MVVGGRRIFAVPHRLQVAPHPLAFFGSLRALLSSSPTLQWFEFLSVAVCILHSGRFIASSFRQRKEQKKPYTYTRPKTKVRRTIKVEFVAGWRHASQASAYCLCHSKTVPARDWLFPDVSSVRRVSALLISGSIYFGELRGPAWPHPSG
ncbi:uncharacterized protein K452DRAFT_133556 [Aplosporella prunicola CBS 121167]|uniref:Uncharacterized protein n=1 Tax=Aplosporella prunicola CBS 121167 TaxID=1176127 RepID=A0A6A6BQC5_9PEZI|nr:uncharacterized protein K452DRAFT_133556 [Aplosporella prunicola CBS 121167]KAF2145007.1 hypothetical protein K452DRAFT_133556 [Aplosporella prunicola CBS 121167]